MFIYVVNQSACKLSLYSVLALSRGIFSSNNSKFSGAPWLDRKGELRGVFCGFIAWSGFVFLPFVLCPISYYIRPRYSDNLQSLHQWIEYFVYGLYDADNKILCRNIFMMYLMWNFILENSFTQNRERFHGSGAVIVGGTGGWQITSSGGVSGGRVGHDDVIKWKHFPRYWPFVRGIHRSPVNSPHKGQWRGALMFSLICAWTNSWVNNRDAGDLKRHRTHCDNDCDNSRFQCLCYCLIRL